ncbi:hypothetical protein T06_4946 [Trichinella sp. T6]|nr:hypothetical protein T06_4946 [Trichinella sp. T6]
MEALPSSRVVEAAAFTHTGMSFTGPLLTRYYVCLFTCMASGAVHLVAVQMTIARVMQSDNFRSFMTAASELRPPWRHVDVNRVQRDLPCEWGGLLERFVWSIKKSLWKSLRKVLLDEEELWKTRCETFPDIPGRREPQTPRFVPVSTELLTGHTYVEFLAVEAHVPEWQPSGRGPPQWNH